MINKKIVVLFALLSSITIKIFSQSNTLKVQKNQFGIFYGYNQGFLKDHIFSDLNYSTKGLKRGLHYRHLNPNGKNMFETNFSLEGGKLKTEYADYFKSAYILANINIAFLRKIGNVDNNKLKLYLGGKFKTQIQYLDWNDQNTFSYIATHGVALQSSLFYHLKPKHKIETSLSIPVYQLLARPPYNGIDNFITENEDNISELIFTGKPTTVNNYLAFTWATNYTYELSNRFNINLSYTLNYERLFDEHKFIQLQNLLTSSINYKF
jgi:hypothetical protein